MSLIFVAEAPAASEPSLPKGKEPLVLMALLRLLLRGAGSLTGRCYYDHHSLLELLEWGDTETARAAVTGALTKYFHSFYQLSGGKGAAAGRGFGNHTSKVRPLAGYVLGGEVGAGSGS